MEGALHCVIICLKMAIEVTEKLHFRKKAIDVCRCFLLYTFFSGRKILIDGEAMRGALIYLQKTSFFQEGNLRK